jgi:hypothetical protein
LTGPGAADTDAEVSVLARLRDLGRTPQLRLRRELRAAYLETLRVARQLREHAGRMPYPAMATEVERLAAEADGHVAELAAALRGLGGDADRDVAAVPREGRNAWARLTTDLADLQSLHRHYTEMALHYDVDFPDVAGTLDRLARVTVRMEQRVRALIARADPHAQN